MTRKIAQQLARSSCYKFFLSILHNMYIIATKPEESSLRCLRSFDDMMNRIMMKEFPSDLDMDKGIPQLVIFADSFSQHTCNRSSA